MHRCRGRKAGACRVTLTRDCEHEAQSGAQNRHMRAQRRVGGQMAIGLINKGWQWGG